MPATDCRRLRDRLLYRRRTQGALPENPRAYSITAMSAVPVGLVLSRTGVHVLMRHARVHERTASRRGHRATIMVVLLTPRCSQAHNRKLPEWVCATCTRNGLGVSFLGLHGARLSRRHPGRPCPQAMSIYSRVISGAAAMTYISSAITIRSSPRGFCQPPVTANGTSTFTGMAASSGTSIRSR